MPERWRWLIDSFTVILNRHVLSFDSIHNVIDLSACADSSVLRWAVEVSKGILGLWFVCGIDLYLPPALPREWKRTAAVLLAFYVRSLSRFYRAGRHWQKAVVQSILSRAVGFDTLIYGATICNRALDNLMCRIETNTIWRCT